jgi:hypothetical protein
VSVLFVKPWSFGDQIGREGVKERLGVGSIQPYQNRASPPITPLRSFSS